MSRIYQPPSKITKSASPAPATVPVNSKEAESPNRVASNVKLFTNNLSASSSSLSPKQANLAAVSNQQFDSKLINSSSNTKLTTHSETNNINNTNQTHTENTEFDPMSQELLNTLISRLESVTTRLETIQFAPPNSLSISNGAKVNGVHEVEQVHPSVAAFDDLLGSALKAFLDVSNQIGNDVKTIADLVQKAMVFERSFLHEASKCLQPTTDVLNKFYTQFSKYIEEITSFREKNRKSEFFNHFSAISESIGALGWIAVQPAPSPYIKEMSDSAQFYTNRVLKDFKEKDPKHASWVKLWLQLLSELQAYVKQHHTTGVTWNSARKSATFNPNLTASSQSSKPANGPSGPPPPPLPNFNELLADENKKPTTSVCSLPSTNALFAELNKGCDITSGLKKVSDEQKTHKNPNLRQTAVVPGSASSTASLSKVKVSTPAVSKPAVFELDDKKWKIEYQSKRNDLVIENTEIKQTVYIYKCNECTITVKGKVNSILIDSCSRVGLLFDDVLSTVEFINSQSVQMQVLGSVPTVCIEKTDGCQVYLSKSSLNTEIISSKSSAMNILVPNETGDEFDEQPVPEQFKTVINASKKLVTSATETA